jgi:hypothetical protein
MAFLRPAPGSAPARALNDEVLGVGEVPDSSTRRPNAASASKRAGGSSSMSQRLLR